MPTQEPAFIKLQTKDGKNYVSSETYEEILTRIKALEENVNRLTGISIRLQEVLSTVLIEHIKPLLLRWFKEQYGSGAFRNWTVRDPMEALGFSEMDLSKAFDALVEAGKIVWKAGWYRLAKTS